jgi:hypothetical protein
MVILSVLMRLLKEQDAHTKAKNDYNSADQVRKQVRIGLENSALEPCR